MSVIVPKHIVITCDGNRRWAKARKLPQIEGHRRGVQNIETLVKAAKELGVEYLTCWVLSTENLEKRKNEFEYMMDLAREFSDKYKKLCVDEQIKYRHVGRKDRLPADVLKDIEEIEEVSKDFTTFNFSLAIDYGGRDEILRAATKLQADGSELTEEAFSGALDTSEMPDPDLLIRTGDRQRLSGIMPWQSIYSELYFSDKMFPDFNKEALKEAIEYFATTQRNFGK